MKYIVWIGSSTGIPQMHLFPQHAVHALVAAKLNVRPISAGFVTDDLRCSGESQSLNLKSRGDEDTFILRCYFGMTGLAVPCTSLEDYKKTVGAAVWKKVMK